MKPKPEPTNKGLCQAYVFFSISRPPLQHITIIPIVDDEPDLEEIYCSCEGFAYAGNNSKECWHIERAIELCLGEESP